MVALHDAEEGETDPHHEGGDGEVQAQGAEGLHRAEDGAEAEGHAPAAGGVLLAGVDLAPHLRVDQAALGAEAGLGHGGAEQGADQEEEQDVRQVLGGEHDLRHLGLLGRDAEGLYREVVAGEGVVEDDHEEEPQEGEEHRGERGVGVLLGVGEPVGPAELTRLGYVPLGVLALEVLGELEPAEDQEGDQRSHRSRAHDHEALEVEGGEAPEQVVQGATAGDAGAPGEEGAAQDGEEEHGLRVLDPGTPLALEPGEDQRGDHRAHDDPLDRGLVVRLGGDQAAAEEGGLEGGVHPGHAAGHADELVLGVAEGDQGVVDDLGKTGEDPGGPPGPLAPQPVLARPAVGKLRHFGHLPTHTSRIHSQRSHLPRE